MNKLTSLDLIEKRIAELQRAHVCLQEELKGTQNKAEQVIDEMALRLIDILDLIDTTKSPDYFNDASTGPVIIRKIEKRLLELILRWQIREISFRDGQVKAGKARVLETRPASDETIPGLIIEVCRKGYQRGDKTIRPADVITAAKR